MIAAVTNFYNPSHRKVKWDNFYKFREGLKGIPLYIVEAAFGDEPFSLPKDEFTLQLRCRDVIWQQYRLVNLAIRNLPDKYDKIVWIDADIIFPATEWWHLNNLLDDYKVVQPYSHAQYLSASGSIDHVKPGVVKQSFEGHKSAGGTFSSSLDMSKSVAIGLSWALRRDVVEEFGIYDLWITGSSDNAFVLGIWGDWDNLFIQDRLNANMKSHFMDWAIPFHNYVSQSISYIDQPITHLWHGSRNYKKRWKCLKDFDPYVDVRVADNGVIEWSSEKPDLHECCKSMCLYYDLPTESLL